jgi:hypothetical protein
VIKMAVNVNIGWVYMLLFRPASSAKFVGKIFSYLLFRIPTFNGGEYLVSLNVLQYISSAVLAGTRINQIN